MPNELYSLSQLFQNKLFRIPDYQRGYAWQQNQFIDFWDDLNNLSMDRYHYTGLLSIKPLNTADTTRWGSDRWMIEKGFKPCHVVDGQQRLTTFIILVNEIISFVCALDKNSNKEDKDIVIGSGAETIEEIKAKYICQKRPPQKIITTYLFGYEIDNPSEKYLRYKIFNEPHAESINETYYTRNLKAAKDFFHKNIQALFDAEGEDGVEKLYRKLTQKLMFNLHEIADDYDVFVAFETMNNRGKRLTNLELLKNRLIYLTTIYSEKQLDDLTKDELRKQINDAWKEIYFQLGRNRNCALKDDEFLKAHWIVYFTYSRRRGDDYIKYLLNKFSAKNVFEKTPIAEIHEIQVIENEENVLEDEELSDSAEMNEEFTEYENRLEPHEISAYVNSLKDFAKYWYFTYFPEESDLSDEDKLWIDRLNRIGIVYFRPLVAVALCKSNNETERTNLLKQIERFIFLFFRLAYYRSNYQSSVYYIFARDIYNGNSTISDVINSLEEITNSNIQYIFSYFYNVIEKKFSSGKKDGYYGWNSLRYFLYEYEFHLWESTGVKRPSWELFSKIEKDKISIEHILPQTPSNSYWQNQFRQYTGNATEMIKLTGTLGNLLPLAQSINSSLQNDSFPDKRDSIGHRERCYLNGSNSENEVARENIDWDAQRIFYRCVRLLGFMEQRWNIPMTQEQKEQLTFINFVNDGRSLSSELPTE